MAAEGQDLGGGAMFTDEELSEIAGLKLGEDYIEVTCGCTSRRYGDAVGRLQVFLSGDLQITCECTPGCPEGKILFLSLFSYLSASIIRFSHCMREISRSCEVVRGSCLITRLFDLVGCVCSSTLRPCKILLFVLDQF